MEERPIENFFKQRENKKVADEQIIQARKSGQVSGGAKAIPILVSLFPVEGLISRLIESAPGGPRGLEFVYSVFSRVHDAGACRFRAEKVLLHS